MDAESPTRQRDRRRGVIIVGCAFVAAVSVSWWARTVSAPEPDPQTAPETSGGVVGFPKSVDVMLSLEGAHSLAKRDDLLGIGVWGASPDGSVDVSVPGDRVRYVFGSGRGEGALPPHPPGQLPRHDTCGRRTVHVKEVGMFADPDMPTYPCGGPPLEPLPYPRCGPKEVWQAAIKKGVPTNKKAHIEYFRSAAGPAWRFELDGAPMRFVLYGDCERELTGSEASGASP